MMRDIKYLVGVVLEAEARGVVRSSLLGVSNVELDVIEGDELANFGLKGKNRSNYSFFGLLVVNHIEGEILCLDYKI